MGNQVIHKAIPPRDRRDALLSIVLLVCLPNTACRVDTPAVAKSTAAPLANRAIIDVKAPPPQLTTVGQVVGFNTVVVKSRVDGPIVRIDFQEGQNVRRGDVLAVVDPAPYRVALNEAVASLAKDSAQLSQSKAMFARDTALFSEGVIARQELDKQEAEFHQLEGVMGVDQAAVDHATLEFNYTKIIAPLDGRVGFRTIDVGNIVHPSDSGGIVTITQLQPISVVFSASPSRLNQILQSIRKHPIHVDAFSEDGKALLGHGEVLTSDTSIDPVTGTAKIKARFTNKEQLLWPNEFVQVEVRLDDTGQRDSRGDEKSRR
jgi:membrane fusion protein, multidrug efflux system